MEHRDGSARLEKSRVFYVFPVTPFPFQRNLNSQNILKKKEEIRRRKWYPVSMKDGMHGLQEAGPMPEKTRRKER